MIATDPLDSRAAFYIADQEIRDEENNMALKLNAYVARGLHSKKLEYKIDGSPYDSAYNHIPQAFSKHFLEEIFHFLYFITYVHILSQGSTPIVIGAFRHLGVVNDRQKVLPELLPNSIIGK